MCYEFTRAPLRLLHTTRRVVGTAQRTTCNEMAQAGLGSSWFRGRTTSDRVARNSSNLGWENLVWIDAVGNGMVPHDGLTVSRSSQITNQYEFHGQLQQVARYSRHKMVKTSTTEAAVQGENGGGKLARS